jgi:hypothetical protein
MCTINSLLQNLKLIEVNLFCQLMLCDIVGIYIYMDVCDSLRRTGREQSCDVADYVTGGTG